MSLFAPHPCTDCEKYGNCEQFDCNVFKEWFNSTYIQMQAYNALADQGRIKIESQPIRKHFVVELNIDQLPKSCSSCKFIDICHYKNCPIQEVYY